jgi:hypothetical protein
MFIVNTKVHPPSIDNFYKQDAFLFNFDKFSSKFGKNSSMYRFRSITILNVFHKKLINIPNHR